MATAQAPSAPPFTGIARRISLLAAVAIALTPALGAARATAAPTWLAPSDLSEPGQNATNPQIALDGDGDAIAVWPRLNGANMIIQASTRPAGGSWQAPVDLSAPGQNAFYQQIALDRDGDAIAIWSRSNGTDYIIQASARPAGGAWQAPVDLSAPGGSAYLPQIALDAQGNAVAIWYRATSAGDTVQASLRPAASGVWQTPVNVSTPGASTAQPQVKFDAQGNAIAVWSHSNGSNYIVQASIRPAASGIWQTPVDVSAPGANAYRPQIAADAQGDVIAIWSRANGGPASVIQASLRPSGGAWQAPVDLSTGASADTPLVALDPRGNATAVWYRNNGANFVVQSAARPAGGAWEAPVDLSMPGGDAAGQQVALDSDGNAVAVWNRSNGTNWVIQSATRPAGSGWRAPVDISPQGHNSTIPQLALDAQGNAVATWYSSIGPNFIVQAAGYDASGPQLRGLSIPQSGTRGEPLRFAVAPLDVWSALGSTTWSFGDGSSTTGTTVTHTYAAPGSYTVTLSSADALGNATGTSRTVTIAPSEDPPSTPTDPPGTRPIDPPGTQPIDPPGTQPTDPPATQPADPRVTPPAKPSLHAPGVTRLAQAHVRWHPGIGLPSTKPGAKPPKRGTIFAYTLDQPARVSLRFIQTQAGRTVNGRCVRQTAKNRTHRPCTLSQDRGRLTVNARAGTNTITFQGRLTRSKALKPGRYTVALTATGATGQQSRAKTLTFTILR